MNRTMFSAIPAFLLWATAAGAAPQANIPAVSAAPTVKEPVYLYLYSSVTDHVNLDITEDRLRRLLPMLERYQKAHPDAHLSATILFSGSVSQALADRNSTTHIVDFVKGYIQKGVIEAGYDGSDEPTYATRPAVDLAKMTDPKERWLVRIDNTKQFLTEGRDPLTGEFRPGTSGGLKKMQEVFGEAACINGLALPLKYGPGTPVYAVTKTRTPANVAPPEPVMPDAPALEIGGDTEAILNLRALNAKTIIFGVPDVNPAYIPGFRNGRAGFSYLMSPTVENPPELYWQDHVLRTSEASSEATRLIHAYAGPDAIKSEIEKMPRNRVHILHVKLADELNYVKPEFLKSGGPALRYAYDHPTAPNIPAVMLLPKTAVDQAFAKEDAALKWTLEDFLSADSGNRLVSSTDLTRMVAPESGFRVSTDDLRAGLADYMKAWGNDTYAPNVFRAGARYLSRAEMFQVLADALAAFHRDGKLPESVDVVSVYGPVRVLTGHGPNIGEVSVAELARICAELAPPLHDTTPNTIPKNAVPVGIPVNGEMLNPAQFLRLMALAVLNPSPEAKINVRMVYEFSGPGMLLPKTRPDMDDGFIWTLKPAQLEQKMEAMK